MYIDHINHALPLDEIAGLSKEKTISLDSASLGTIFNVVSTAGTQDFQQISGRDYLAAEKFSPGSATAARKLEPLEDGPQVVPGDLDELRVIQSKLARKKITNEITETERKELSMVRWLIDVSEEAVFSDSLRQIDAVIQVKERVAAEINSFVSYAKSLSHGRKR